MKRTELKGQIFGRLKVKEWQSGSRQEKGGWICQCECGNTTIVPSNSLTDGRTRSCGCIPREQNWQGVGKISGNYWSRLKKNAEKRGISFDIKIEDAWELFLNQEGRCAVSGRELHLERQYLCPRKDTPRQTASLDRINSDGGYSLNNVQWVHIQVNLAKHKLTTEEFLQLCREVVEHGQHNTATHGKGTH